MFGFNKPKEKDAKRVYYYVGYFKDSRPTILNNRFYSNEQAQTYGLKDVNGDFKVIPLATGSISMAKNIICKRMEYDTPEYHRPPMPVYIPDTDTGDNTQGT
jgi:hypothetical protein